MTKLIQHKNCKSCNTSDPSAFYICNRGRRIQPCIQCCREKYRESHPVAPVVSIKGEEWRTLADFPSYAVSNMGRVKRTRSGEATYSGRILKPLPHGRKRKYQRVQLSRGQFQYIHRLVALAFLAPDPLRTHVNHKDNDPSNNRVENLEWCNHPENMKHASAGFESFRKKITSNHVRTIRRMRKEGKTHGEIAVMFNLNQSTVSRILNGQVWKNVV